MFYNGFNEHVGKLLKTDLIKYLVVSYFITNTNYQDKTYKNLKKNQCAFSYSALESILTKDTKVTRYRLQKVIKELEAEGFIKWVHKARSRHDLSVVEVLSYGLSQENESYGKSYGESYGKSLDNQSLCEGSHTDNHTVNHTLFYKSLSKNNLSTTTTSVKKINKK